MDADVRAAVARVVNYSWASEEADYFKQPPEDRHAHVFEDLRILQAWLDATVDNLNMTTADIEKYALRFLAASPDTANESFSDAAADLYRDRYGEDYGDNTFNLTTLRKGDQ